MLTGWSFNMSPREVGIINFHYNVQIMENYCRLSEECGKGRLASQVYLTDLAVVCWAMWKSQNKTCFDKIIIKHPYDLVFQASTLSDMWAGLHKSDTQNIMKIGAKTMFKTVVKVCNVKEDIWFYNHPKILEYRMIRAKTGVVEEKLTRRKQEKLLNVTGVGSSVCICLWFACLICQNMVFFLSPWMANWNR